MYEHRPFGRRWDRHWDCLKEAKYVRLAAKSAACIQQ